MHNSQQMTTRKKRELFVFFGDQSTKDLHREVQFERNPSMTFHENSMSDEILLTSSIPIKYLQHVKISKRPIKVIHTLFVIQGNYQTIPQS
jgi:hypothetical protein